MDVQSTSSFFALLPGELRNEIYSLVLTSDRPIINPSTRFLIPEDDIPSLHHSVPSLGVPLLRTCKRIYSEMPLHPLYAQNRFRFTSSTKAQAFLTFLAKEHAAQIQDVEIDLREVSHNHPRVARNWNQYVSWLPNDTGSDPDDDKSISLRSNAPGLKTLRLNIESWNHSETLGETALLRDLLQNVQGLERVVLTGKDGSALLFGNKEIYLQQWGPIIFVGVMRFARLAGLVGWMANGVSGGVDEKMVRWSQEDRAVTLEVISMASFRKDHGSVPFQRPEAVSIKAGYCSLAAYEQRWTCKWPSIVETW